MVFNDYYVPLWCFIQSKCDRECFDVSKELGQLPSEWVPCSDTLSIIRRYFTGTRTHPLPALSNFRVTLILDNLLRLKNETAVCVHLSLSSQDLECDQNIGRYYFNFPAPCSLPILFSAAWCNNKCYLDPYLVRGRNGFSDDSLIRPAPNNFLALSLSLFIRGWAGTVQVEPDLSVCDEELWGSIWLSPAQHGEIFFQMVCQKVMETQEGWDLTSQFVMLKA